MRLTYCIPLTIVVIETAPRNCPAWRQSLARASDKCFWLM